jgi:hypothetical protein
VLLLAAEQVPVLAFQNTPVAPQHPPAAAAAVLMPRAFPPLPLQLLHQILVLLLLQRPLPLQLHLPLQLQLQQLLLQHLLPVQVLQALLLALQLCLLAPLLSLLLLWIEGVLLQHQPLVVVAAGRGLRLPLLLLWAAALLLLRDWPPVVAAGCGLRSVLSRCLHMTAACPCRHSCRRMLP